MSHQFTDHEIEQAALKKLAVKAELKRFIRRNAPRKRDRDALIERAATMPLTDKQRAELTYAIATRGRG